MKLLVGLGNPGAEYAATRHNIGFMALDRVQVALDADKWEKKFSGFATTATVAGEKLLLLKPQTFMNLSGQSVQAASTFHKIAPADIFVFHDELELGAGRVRVKQGGGSAGHNGLKSIDSHLGADYWRVRLGIGRPPANRESVHDYVLHPFAKEDSVWLKTLLDALASSLGLLLIGQQSQFMNKITLAVQPVLPAGSDNQEDI